MTEYDQIADALDELERITSDTGAAIEAGDTVALDGLPEFADSVCRKIVDLPDNGGKFFAGRMSTIVEALNLLQQKVDARHQDLSSQLASLEAGQGADDHNRST